MYLHTAGTNGSFYDFVPPTTGCIGSIKKRSLRSAFLPLQPYVSQSLSAAVLKGYSPLILKQMPVVINTQNL